jgi:hypothetical protein
MVTLRRWPRSSSAARVVSINAHLFRRPFETGEITGATGAVDDANHLHAVFDQPIKGQPTFNDEYPCALANLWAGGTKLRMIPQ